MLACCKKNITVFCRLAEARSYPFRLQAFLDAIRDGATCIGHPDTLDELRSHGLMDGSILPLAFGPKVIPSRFLPKGTLLAARIPTQEQTIDRIGTPNFSKDWIVR